MEEELAKELKNCKKVLEMMRALKLELQDLKSVMKYQDEAILKHMLTKSHSSSSSEEELKKLPHSENEENLAPPAPTSQQRLLPPAAPAAPVSSSSIPVPNKKEIPKVNYITVQEFDNVPKYMKGRISVDTVNKLITDLNLTIMEKYKLCRTHRKKLNENHITLVNEFKSQECEEVRGMYFCTDADLKLFAGVKTDKQLNSYLTILRHAGRIKDIRSAGGLVRHVVLQS